MMGSMENEFFEEDEPAEKVVGIFDSGEKGLTAPPAGGQVLPGKGFVVIAPCPPIDSSAPDLEFVQA
jgi:hypothetical protein